MIEQLSQWIRCLLGTHDVERYTYWGLATTAGKYGYPEAYLNGWIRMYRAKCEHCHETITTRPVPVEDDPSIKP